MKRNGKRKTNNSTKLLTEAQRYDMLEQAKDSLFELIHIKKWSWGYEAWCDLLFMLQAERWDSMESKIRTFRNTKNSRLALEIIADIREFSI